MSGLSLFGWLLVGHALADFPLQGDFLAKAKNHTTPIPGCPWWLCLAAHSLICAGAVAALTCWQLGALEFVLHFGTDWLKNEGALGSGETAFAIDQAIHVMCKAAWAYLWIAF